MSKLSFRARALDASKPMPIFMAEELPDLHDYSAINRAVPQMPTGMQKEEECEHHLQRAIVAGLIIPTPEVADIPNKEFYDNVYPANYKQPRQLIHMQPFTMEQDIPDYDMDSDDERWLQSQTQKLELSELKFEEMMDRLEKSSGQTVVTLNEAKALLKEDDDLIIAVFDYWLNKRLKTQHPLILTVKTEHRAGQAANNPYLAFRRRTEKMQTRKNRKNDEASYEKMLKLRRDLCRAVTLLELVKRREKMKREYVHLTVEVFEKRYLSKDFSGSIIAEAAAVKSASQPRPAFTQIFHNHYPNQQWSNKVSMKDEVIPRREKRQYKKRKHKSLAMHGRQVDRGQGTADVGAISSDEDTLIAQVAPETDEIEEEGQFAFRRNKFCSYHMPLPHEGNWPWSSQEEHGAAEKRYRFTLTSLSNPRRCIGFARRRVGRGGRIILDRVATNCDDYWRTLDFKIYEPNSELQSVEDEKSGDINVKDNKIKIVNSGHNNVISDSLLCRTDDIKIDLNHFGTSCSDDNLRTSVIEGGDDNNSVKVQVKEEPQQQVDAPVEQNEEKDDMVEFLRSLRRDWLHFRPKTPPPDYEPPCHLLPCDDAIFTPRANQPFSMEIIPIEPPSSLLDTTSFVTDPFILNENDLDMNVPITDTRQQQSSGSTQIGSNTLNKRFNMKYNNNCGVTLNDSVFINNNTMDVVIDRTAGCSSFTLIEDDDEGEKKEEDDEQIEKFFHNISSGSISQIRKNCNISNNNGDFINLSSHNNGPTLGINDLNRASGINCLTTTTTSNLTCSTAATAALSVSKLQNTSTLTSLKLNNSVSDSRKESRTVPTTSDMIGTSTSSSTSSSTATTATSGAGNTNGLLQQLGFDVPPNRTKNNKLYAYSSGVGFSNASSGTLSLHTSAHTLTLNSHSANILEIPIPNDPSDNKLVNSQLPENATSATNNKKTIVRKNNLIMEVT